MTGKNQHQDQHDQQGKQQQYVWKTSHCKMLQIRWNSATKPLKWQLPAPKMCRFHENDAKTMNKKRLEVKNAANTGEIAASRFKMLQV